MAFDSQTAIANRQDYDHTFTDEYSKDQTNATLFSPPTNGVISVKGIWISTKATSGFARLTIDGDTIGTLFAESGGNSGYIPTYKQGGQNSPVKITTTFGDANNYFILVNYKVE